MSKRHQGNAIIVTGAAGAIGYATCEVLARESVRLLMVDIAGDRLEARVSQLAGQRYEAIAHLAGCADEVAVEGYAKAALDAFGKVVGFFNNAGIEGALAPTHEYDIDEFDKIIRVNLRSMFLGLRFILPGMVERGKGAVVNTASIGSERGLAGACAYNAAKHGAVGLTRTAASEVAQKGVRVNCVVPGVIETPLLAGMLEQMFDGDVEAGMAKLGQTATLNRIGQPREVGDVVSFLLSDEASYVNGAKWEIDGGALATIRNDI